MRLGLVLDAPAGAAEMGTEAAAAARVGLDFVWVAGTDRSGNRRDATVVAAALSRVVRDTAVVVEADARHHPLELAEKLVVTDLLLGGRLTVAFTAGEGVPTDKVAESIDVVCSGLTGRPFRHAGTHWSFPTDGTGLVQVTPAPAQLNVPVWVVGSQLAPLAERWGLPVVAAEGEDATALPPPGLRWPRAVRRTLAVPHRPEADTSEVVATLVDERDRAGIGLCAVRLDDPDPVRRLGAIEVLGSRVRPQLFSPQLDRALVESWSRPASTHLEEAAR